MTDITAGLVYGSMEARCANDAVMVIAAKGGEVTFDEFDQAMKAEYHGDTSGPVYRRAKSVRSFIPMSWADCTPSHDKGNIDKRSVFAACALGLVEQTETGYSVVRS